MNRATALTTADALEGKARAIYEGLYGLEVESGENASWLADLYTAIALLRQFRIEELTAAHLEEIDCCADVPAGAAAKLRLDLECST